MEAAALEEACGVLGALAGNVGRHVQTAVRREVMGLSVIPGEDVQHELGGREGETPVKQGLENDELPRLGLSRHVVRLGLPVPAIGPKLPILD